MRDGTRIVIIPGDKKGKGVVEEAIAVTYDNKYPVVYWNVGRRWTKSHRLKRIWIWYKLLVNPTAVLLIPSFHWNIPEPDGFQEIRFDSGKLVKMFIGNEIYTSQR